MAEHKHLGEGKEIGEDQDELSEDELPDVAGGKLDDPPEPD